MNNSLRISATCVPSGWKSGEKISIRREFKNFRGFGAARNEITRRAPFSVKMNPCRAFQVTDEMDCEPFHIIIRAC
jgi:hypothetical protein